MHTTLNQIRAHKSCSKSWAKLLHYLNIATILESNDLGNILWHLRSLIGHEREVRLLAVSFAREVQHLMTDPRSLAALEVAEAFANGQASQENLDAARLAAHAAAEEASSLSAAVGCAAYAAYATAEPNATHAASDTAWEAAAAAGEEAYLAAYTAAFANSGACAARAAARASATSAARDRQTTLLLKALTS